MTHIFRLDLPQVTAARPNVHPADRILRRVGRSAPMTPPVDLLKGQLLNSPVPPFGGLEQFGMLLGESELSSLTVPADISPDSSEIAFTAAVDDNQEAWNTSWRIYTLK